MIQVGDVRVTQGEKKSGWLPVINSKLCLPVTMISGKQEGPTVLITAGVHGAEYIGIQTAMELSGELEPEELSGNVIFLLMANPDACYDFARFIVPEDGNNLNQMFPGNAMGTLSEKIAWTMTVQLQSQADYYLDLHAGDTSEEAMPFVYYNGACIGDISEASEELASAANMSLRVKSTATTGAYSSACMRGLPAILMERGGGGRFSRQQVEAYKQDIRNILIRTKLLEGKEIHDTEQKSVTRANYVEAVQDGFWYPSFAAGDSFLKGDMVGEVRDVWGQVLQTYIAEFDGIVLYQTVGMGVRAKDPLVAYGQVPHE